jgi:hypothetical protein
MLRVPYTLILGETSMKVWSTRGVTYTQWLWRSVVGMIFLPCLTSGLESIDCDAIHTKAGFRFRIKRQDAPAALPRSFINQDRQRKQWVKYHSAPVTTAASYLRLTNW